MAAPDLEVLFEPISPSIFEPTAIFAPLAARGADRPRGGQLSVDLHITNREASPVSLTSIGLSFPGGPSGTTLYAVAMTIAPGETQEWSFTPDQSGGPIKDTIFLEQPAPAEVAITLTSPAFTEPFRKQWPLKPHVSIGNSYRFPARADDLSPGEYWIGMSGRHAAGDHGTQLFAYDLGVQAARDLQIPNAPVPLSVRSWFMGRNPAPPTKNEDFRAFLKPVYAMADGIVHYCKDDVPDNIYPAVGVGAGNHFVIDHGIDRATYAHLFLGSVNEALKAPGTVVHEGDYLGLVGNSGHSGEPHLHIQVNPLRDAPRPLTFRNISVLEMPRALNADWPPQRSDEWYEVGGESLPGGVNGVDCSAIWPSSLPPKILRPIPVWWPVVQGLAWIWLIILGSALLVSPGGSLCIACAGPWPVTFGIVSLVTGLGGLAVTLAGRLGRKD